MNISQAKLQIKNAMTAYFTTDEYGNYLIPPQSQRPVFLMGPPGIGKTAIMQQIAEELGVGLISYSMTHHTRQSALGLPVIVHKEYGGVDCAVSEYTMSEIIASVYDMMEQSGVERGILFLDEINCVSETLTPTMLQFLQYKTFGRHQVPKGWLVVTAGNPVEYNRSAREFDIVTWDRLKRIDIEPDYPAWKEYALKKGVHAAVLSYLDVRRENFYSVSLQVDGHRFVTARSWEDLSDMIKLYERNSLPVDVLLVRQYLQDSQIAEDFSTYYELFNKYKSDYQLDRILSGSALEDIRYRAKNADFDERLSLIGLMLDRLNSDIRGVMDSEDMLSELLPLLKEVKAGAALVDVHTQLEERKQREERRGTLSVEKRRQYDAILSFLSLHERKKSDFSAIKQHFDAEVADMRRRAAQAGSKLEAMLEFSQAVWGDGQELLILVTELTINWYAARFIARYGCDAYYRHSEALMLHQRHAQILRQLDALQDQL